MSAKCILPIRRPLLRLSDLITHRAGSNLILELTGFKAAATSTTGCRK